ncbi:MAG: DUF2927 domain-containing protein [Christensenellales bacterium]
MKRVSALLALMMLLTCCLSGLAQTAPAFDPPNELERRRQALYCFLDSAFGSEYGQDHALVRWQKPIRLSLAGGFSPEDEAFAVDFLAQLNARVPGFPGVSRVEAAGKPHIQGTYAPLDELADYVEGYAEGNWGYFSYWYDDYRMTKAQIGIASDVTNQVQRNHLLMEELLGALGLGTDIYTYSDSVLYEPWTEVQQPSDLDWLMLGYLYDPRLTPGMSQVKAYAALLGTLKNP